MEGAAGSLFPTCTAAVRNHRPTASPPVALAAPTRARRHTQCQHRSRRPGRCGAGSLRELGRHGRGQQARGAAAQVGSTAGLRRCWSGAAPQHAGARTVCRTLGTCARAVCRRRLRSADKTVCTNREGLAAERCVTAPQPRCPNRYWELKRPREEGAAQARLPLLAPPRTRAWSATVKLPKTSCPQSPFVSSQLSPFVAAPQQSPFVAAQPQSPFVAAQQQQQQPLPLAASQQLAAAARLPSPGASQTLAGTLSMGASPLAHMPHSCPLGASLAFNSSLATGPSQALAMSQQDFAAYATVFQDTVVRERRRRESQERRLRQLQLEQRAAQEASLRACVSWQGPEAGGAAQISPEASCALPPVASVNASGMCAELADMALEVADSPGQQSPTEGQCATEPDVPLVRRCEVQPPGWGCSRRLCAGHALCCAYAGKTGLGALPPASPRQGS